MPAAKSLERACSHSPELAVIRRDLHAHPELGLEEHRTAAVVAERLRAWGIETTTGVGGTGVVGTIKGNLPGQRAIGLRADMDALALTEQTGLPYASTYSGRMHACGHDGHTTMLLGAARQLAEHKDFAGTVHLIFQPAEEGRGGAKAMLADGLFERFPCDAVYGMHNSPGVPVGRFVMRQGACMAGGAQWRVRFTGKGGHGGSAPHLTADLSIVQAHFVLGLQTIVGRNVPPMETALISVGYIQGGSGDACNVLPSALEVGGTARYFRGAVKETIDRRIRELALQLAAMHGAGAEIDIGWGAIPLVNHEAQCKVGIAAAAAVVGADAVETKGVGTTGGEDFAFMLDIRPGAFIGIGNGVGADGNYHGLHSPKYDFNDEIIPLGVAYWVELVNQELNLAS
jgi:hippurate hydrolase